MRNSVSQREWRAFAIPDLFTVQTGNQSNMTALSEGETPLVSARKYNNGYKGFVSAAGSLAFPGQCITLNNDGDGGAGLAYYQPYRMLLDSHVTALVPKEKVSKYALIFIARCMSNQHELYGNGHSINESRLARFKFMLPVTTDGKGDPDYLFMEAFMREKERTMLAQYAKRTDTVLTESLPTAVQWKTLPVSKVFSSIQRGKRLKTADHIPGTVPYVSSSASTNGVDAFVGNTQGCRLFRNCISLANSGSVGTAFFQPFSFIASDHVTSLSREGLSKYVYLFLAVCLGKMSTNYSFNREISDDRIAHEKVTIPVTDDDQPDFAYMEAVMRRKEAEQLDRYARIRLHDK